jgi:hypothetical protein
MKDNNSHPMIYKKTPLGMRAFLEKPSQLSPRLRSVLIMIDGKRNFNELAAVLAAVGAEQSHLDELQALGLIEAPESDKSPQPSNSPLPAEASGIQAGNQPLMMDDQERYRLAYPIATRLISGIGFKGFRLNLALEGASNISDLMGLSERIREAVGEEKYQELKPYLQR